MNLTNKHIFQSEGHLYQENNKMDDRFLLIKGDGLNKGEKINLIFKQMAIRMIEHMNMEDFYTVFDCSASDDIPEEIEFMIRKII